MRGAKWEDCKYFTTSLQIKTFRKQRLEQREINSAIYEELDLDLCTNGGTDSLLEFGDKLHKLSFLNWHPVKHLKMHQIFCPINTMEN